MSERMPEAGASQRRRRVLLAAGVLLVLAVLAVVAITTGGTGGGRSAAATSGPAATAGPTAPTPAGTPSSAAPGAGTPAAGTAPTGPSAAAPAAVDIDQAPPSLAPVPLTTPAAAGDGVTGSLVSLEAIQGTASGPGNISGPALRVTVRLTNGRTAAVPLDGVAVALTYGTDQTPASPLDDPSESPFSGTLAPGHSAQGVYVFTVPADQRALVTVSVGWQAGAPIMVFTGSAR